MRLLMRKRARKGKRKGETERGSVRGAAGVVLCFLWWEREGKGSLRLRLTVRESLPNSASALLCLLAPSSTSITKPAQHSHSH